MKKPILHPDVKKILQKFIWTELRRLTDDKTPLRIVDVLGTLPQAIKLAKKRFSSIAVVPTEEDYRLQFDNLLRDRFGGKTIFVFAPHFDYRDLNFAFRVLEQPNVIFVQLQNYWHKGRVWHKLCTSGRAKVFCIQEQTFKSGALLDIEVCTRFDRFPKVKQEETESPLPLSDYWEGPNPSFPQAYS